MGSDPAAPSKYGFLLRVGIFAFLEIAGLIVLAPLLMPVAGYFGAATLSTFGAAAIANAVALRIWERARLSDIGLGWSAASRKNLLWGSAAGIGAALLVILPALATRAATLEASATHPFHWPSFFHVSVMLLFGAIGEEMLFRGYGFQVLVNELGPYATILPIAALFGIAHLGNANSNVLGIVNTVAWGVVLGVAFLRSRDLWLPIGIHFGWNWTLPVFGANLSGFTMNIGGHQLQWKAGPLWSGGEYGPEAGLLTTLVLIPLAAFVVQGPIRRQRAWLVRDDEDEEATEA